MSGSRSFGSGIAKLALQCRQRTCLPMCTASIEPDAPHDGQANETFIGMAPGIALSRAEHDATGAGLARLLDPDPPGSSPQPRFYRIWVASNDLPRLVLIIPPALGDLCLPVTRLKQLG